jgi:hypothetical protein
MNLLWHNIDTLHKYTETLIDASKEVGLVEIVEMTKHMSGSRDQNAGQDRDIN